MAAGSSNSIKTTTTFSQKEFKIKLAKAVITCNLPFNYGESSSTFNLFSYLNPNFRMITQHELLQESSKILENTKIELRSIFASLGKNIALSCDVWCSKYATRNFLRITAHWIDSDWVMQRRVLDFILLHDDDDDDDIGPLCDDILKQTKKTMLSWGISEKVMSFTFDDVTDNVVVVDGLKDVVRPILDGKLFRAGCVVRGLNACLEVGWENVKACVDMIWRGVCIVRNNFKLFCERYEYEPKPVLFYDERKWDTIRELLRTFIPFKDAVSEFVALFPWNVAPEEVERNSEDDEPYVPVVISEHDWEVASLFCRLLDVFYVAVDDISGNYRPASCVVLRQLVNVAKLFSELKESVLFNEKFSAMKETFLKNFGKIPEIYCLAAVMDPRINFSGCECLLEVFYQYTDNVTVNVEEEMKGIFKLLHELYNIYAVNSTKCHTSPDPATNDHAWSLISRKRKTNVDSAFEELNIYLQTPPVGSGVLDILAWWKETEENHPVLSSLARDMLTIPLSTLAPDCAFFLNKDKLILDERACKLSESNFIDIDEGTSESSDKQKMELRICLKDWLNAATRTQGKWELEYDECLGLDSGDSDPLDEEGSESDLLDEDGSESDPLAEDGSESDPLDEEESSGSDD